MFRIIQLNYLRMALLAVLLAAGGSVNQVLALDAVPKIALGYGIPNYPTFGLFDSPEEAFQTVIPAQCSLSNECFEYVRTELIETGEPHYRRNWQGYYCHWDDCKGGEQTFATAWIYVACPTGFVENIHDTRMCLRADAQDENKNAGGSCTALGNPVNPASGNKYQIETDYEGHGVFPLRFSRTYNARASRNIFETTRLGEERGSIEGNYTNGTAMAYGYSLTPNAEPGLIDGYDNGELPQSLGGNWSHRYDKTIKLLTGENPLISISSALIAHGDGRVEYFFDDNGQWVSEADNFSTLEQLDSGWKYTGVDDRVELYDSNGVLQSISTSEGWMQTLSYDGDGRLQSVTDSLDRSLIFAYDAEDRIDTMTTPQGVYAYSYGVNGRLSSVTHPDMTTRTYHYEDSNFSDALTGITDERGIRYATYEYDAEGRAIATYHAGNVDRVDIDYHDDGSRTVTNSLGISTTYRTISQLGRSLVTEISGPGCSTCGGSDTTYEYDSANNLTAKVENGIRTEYGDYDDKGQYGYKIDAAGTTEERRTDYTYDARFHNAPTTITRPSVYSEGQRVTTNVYDDFGNRLSQTISGFTPDGTAVSRTTTYTYSGPFNQLSHVDGPRTDVSDITRYHYYADRASEGHNRARLRKVVDALGVRVRGNIQYTATGQIASEERASGLVLTYSYAPGSDRLGH